MTTKNKNPIKPTILNRFKTRLKNYLGRRPHRSFQLTRRRDYARSLKLPGYWAFTAHVRRTLWQNRKLFLLLTLVYAILTAIMVGIASQDTYTTLTDTLRQTGGDVFQGHLQGVDVGLQAGAAIRTDGDEVDRGQGL